VLSRLSEQNVSHAAYRAQNIETVPVTRYFPETIAASMLLDPGLAAAIAGLADGLHWQRSPDYTDAILGEGFCDNYGWCTIVGQHGFFKGDDFELGLFMLGPNRHYIGHYHPAPELYVPLTGPSNWQQSDRAFETKQPGAIIWHDPHVVHATRTGSQPLLAIWSWTRDVATPPRLVIP
jgi:hypothetical protein